MPQSRWLLLMQSVAERDSDGVAFQLLLRNLDDPNDTRLISIRTLDELQTVLLGSWYRRLEAATTPPSNEL